MRGHQNIENFLLKDW
jgi:hypothetical protein